MVSTPDDFLGLLHGHRLTGNEHLRPLRQTTIEKFVVHRLSLTCSLLRQNGRSQRRCPSSIPHSSVSQRPLTKCGESKESLTSRGVTVRPSTVRFFGSKCRSRSFSCSRFFEPEGSLIMRS